jgi:hypothetical protein
MADVQRTRAAILALMADNVTGQISAQDLRDFIVTVMESEFVNPGDFWALPQAKYTTTDRSMRGRMLYSQYIGSDVSFMNVLFMERSTGYWMRADASDSAHNGGLLALATDSYASGVSTAQLLLEGIVYLSTLSTLFSRLIGRPIYLLSGVPGSVSTIMTTNSVVVVGWVMPSDNFGGSSIGKWYFRPDWAVKGT